MKRHLDYYALTPDGVKALGGVYAPTMQSGLAATLPRRKPA
jgi:hypothetical protein